ncbi:MAG: amino acid adenylation domain-containing protein [Symploca sp. SIO1C2]|nr:amino acid adenylation domain-containing protein [Symploca sp. SIO1C2]
MSNYSLGNGSQLSTQQRLLIGLQQANAKLDAFKRAQTEPIAIIGMGCHLPGGVDNPESYWHLLHEGIDAITEVPSARWNLDEYYDPNPEAPGKTYTRCGGFLQQPVDRFDSQFFGISPREAVKLDPQQRLLLEVVWEAIENAGLSADQLRGTQTGVFVGLSSHDYEYKIFGANPSNIDAYSGLGNAQSIAVGRISYILGLLGPTFQLDTACSSSLVAVHLACQSLRAKESNLALVGGVNLMLSPAPTIFFCKTHALSADGRCKTFDAAADGYGRGEGCGIVVLKRLSDAMADGDNILALIRGSAINHDGASSGLTVPNKKAQQLLIHQALDNAKVDPKDVSYIEAHGTGTSLGDPIEVGALGEFFGKNRPDHQPLTIGSAKTNIGHLEAASGVAGLIKVILALQHEKIPPHLNFNEPNPRINWKQLQVRVPTTVLPWPRAEKRRLAGVSAFGFSGTNAHVVVEEAPLPDPIPQGTVDRPVHLLALSTRTQAALKELIIRYQKHLNTHPELTIGDICFSANTGRKHFNHRLSVVAKSVAELSEKLAAWSDAQEVAGVYCEKLPTTTAQPKIAFLFTGQGSQYVNMSKELYSTQPTFRKTIEQCDGILRAYQQKPLLSVLYPEPGETSPIDETAYTQPALFALEYALFELWKSWGIEPDVVMGHSVGEYVAACVAGVFSLEDGLKLIAHRGRLMQQLPSGGEMIAVMASEEKVNQLIAPYTEKVAVAAINGPVSMVISGAAEAMKKVRDSLEVEGIKTKQLQVSHAFHSPLMEPMLADFEVVASQITYNQPQIPLISNVTGARADQSIATASYWVNHVRQPVKFAQSVESLHQEGYDLFIEIGPKPILLGMLRQCLPEEVGVWLPSLRPSQEDSQQMLQSLAQLYVRGVKVDWLGFDRDYSPSKVVLPTYPFQRQRYWVKSTQPFLGNGSDQAQTDIVNLLNHGNTKELAERVVQSDGFTDDQLQVINRALDILTKQHLQQLQGKSNVDQDYYNAQKLVPYSLHSPQHWLYELSWKPIPSVQEFSTPKSGIGQWLIFADQEGVGQQLATELEQQGKNSILVYRGEACEQISVKQWRLRLGEPADYLQVVCQTLADGQTWQGVVHLWSLDSKEPVELTVSSLQESQQLGCGSVLHLVKALNQLAESQSSPDLWLITQGAQAVEKQTNFVQVQQSPLWGLGRVITLEYPQLNCRLLDLDLNEGVISNTQVLVKEMLRPDSENQLAYRQAQRYGVRLKQFWDHTGEDTLPVKETGSYLITGGLGTLGLEVAQWLVEKGAQHLVLTSRQEPNQEAQKVLDQMHHKGINVKIVPGDVGQSEDVERLLAESQSSMPSLRGIIHAAGVLDDGLLMQQSWERFEKVMLPKVAGSWNLHQLSKHLPLDFFVCFSSVASLLGSPSQGNYAAANAFMDALAHYRQGIGLPGLSINWGPWAEGGMASRLQSQHLSRMKAQGITPITPEQGLQALAKLLRQKATQVGVLPINWSQFLEQLSGGIKIPLLEAFSLAQPTLKPKHYGLLEKLEGAKESDRQNSLVSHLQTEVAKVLGMTASQIDVQQYLNTMGLDSMMAVELRNRVQTDLGVDVPIVKFLEDISIVSLATEVNGQLTQIDSYQRVEQDEEEKISLIPAPENKYQLFPIKAIPRDKKIPLSFSQERLWFIDQLEGSKAPYIEHGALQLTGNLNLLALEQTLSEIINRHEVLQTSFPTVDGTPIQVIHPDSTIKINVVDLQQHPKPEREAILQQEVQREATTPFDLEVAPLIRCKLWQLDTSEYVLAVTIHHIVFDGWSMGILIQELSSLYQAFAAGKPSPLPQLPIQYADFALWQRQWLSEEILNTQLNYWKEALLGAPELLQLPTDRPRPHVQSYRGSSENFSFTTELTEKLQQLSRNLGSTLFMTLQAAFATLLYRYSGQKDILIGSPIANRNRHEIQSLIGFFVNTLVLRTRFEDNPSFSQLLKQVRETALTAYEHQDVPFERLFEALRPQRSLSHSTLFQVMFILQNAPMGKLELPGLSVSQFNQHSTMAKFDLLVSMMETEMGLVGIWHYNTDLFDGSTIKRMVTHFQNLLSAIVENPQESVTTLNLLSESERYQLLSKWNDTATQYPKDKCIHQLFSEQVERTPDAVAVVFKDEQLTYRELNTRANQLAHYLQTLAVGPEVLVGICVERSIEMVVGLLGILKAGGAYLPLDPNYPSDRLADILKDSQVSVLLTQKGLVESLPKHQAQVICFDADWQAIETMSQENLVIRLNPDNLAYVVYTSGSTGKPKGVAVEHRNLVNACTAWEEAYQLRTKARSHLQMASFCFDVFSGDLVRALCFGGKLVLCPREWLLESEKLYQLMTEQEVDCAEFVPAVVKNLIEYLHKTEQNLNFMRLLMVGSDSWYWKDYIELQNLCGSDTRLINSYGVTEATIDSCYFQNTELDLPQQKLVPIGRSFANTQVYILDNHLQPVPIGVPGELHIGGAGVARGYLNLPELTAEKFITNPFNNSKLYKTADLARYLPDGNIELLGRIDNQVKIRGFRIELGEIEAVLNTHPQIQQSVVIATEDLSGNKCSVAYYVSQKESLTTKQVREFLKHKLPNYMVPSAFITLETLPLTPNGKVDRKSLPAPDRVFTSVEEYVAPRTPSEEIIANIFAEVLSVQNVGIHDNFFELGGHSLLATQLISRLRVTFEIEIPLRELFESSTVAQLDQKIGQLRTSNCGQASAITLPNIVPAPEKKYQPFPLTSIQQAYWLGRHQNFDLGNIATHGYIELDCSDLNLPQFNQAWQKLIEHHYMLRAVMLASGEQEILEKVPAYEIEVLDLRSQSPSAIAEQLEAIREQMSHEVLPADQWPLFKIRATILDGENTRLHLSSDALIGDAWSAMLLGKQWQQLYENPEILLPPLEISFRDYVLAELLLKDTPQYQLSEEYWFNRNLPPAPELPFAKHPSSVAKPQFKRYAAQLEPEQWQQLKQRATKANLTPTTVLLAAFADILNYWSKSPNFTINLTLFNRFPLHPQVNQLVGDFTSLTLLEVDNSVAYSFTTRAQRVQRQLWQDLDYNYVSGVEVQRELRRQRGSTQPMGVVFTSTLGFNSLIENRSLNQLGEVVYVITQTSQVWLDHQISEQDGALVFNWDVVEELFPAGLIEDMFASYCNWLQQLANTDPAWEETHPQLIPPTQLAQQSAVNNTSTPLSQETLHGLFQKQVAVRSQSPAVITPEQNLTYQELYELANSLGHGLRQLGATPNTLVAVIMEKGWEQIVAVLGILMSGAAYLPISPELPQERQWDLLSQGQVRLVVTQPQLGENLSLPEGIECLSLKQEDLKAAQSNPIESVQTTEDLAYVIYTSGSTGRPKGVMIDHQGAVNTILDINKRFGVGVDDRVLALSALEFDLSVYDIFGILAAGGAIVIPKPAPCHRKDPAHWLELILSHQVTLWNTVPVLMEMLVEQLSRTTDKQVGDLRLALLSGDWLPVNLPSQIELLWSNIQVVSLGGATEASIWSILYPIEKVEPDWKSIPYGKPMENQRFYVLNKSMQPTPTWVSGELYIGGIGLAKGYWQDEEKTKNSFITHPVTQKRLYKTGDLGRYLPGGEIEFLGREDFQVKINGYRIELGEVEGALKQHPAVKEAVVNSYNNQLVAYVVPQQGLIGNNLINSLEASQPGGGYKSISTEMRKYLKQKLPSYMVPNECLSLETLPLTANGKVDRKALPIPDTAKSPSKIIDVAPRTTIELQLTQIWSDVLNLTSVGVQDDFFELGGHSLIAVRLMSLIQQQFQINLPLATLFQSPTIEQLAVVLGSDSSTKLWSPLVAIQPNGSLPPFFCVAGAGGNVLYFHHLARYLGRNQPFYGLQAQGLDGETKPLETMEEIADQYIKAIQTVQPVGPYFLGGHSFGGEVAFEMANQLQAQRQSVALVAILDTPAPIPELNPKVDFSNWDNAMWICDIAGIIEELVGENLQISNQALASLTPDQQIHYFKQQLEMVGVLPPKADIKLVRGLLEIYRTQAQIDYLPHNTSGTSITLFRAQEVNSEQENDHLSYDPAWGWNQFSDSEVEIHTIPGTHISIMTEPHVKILAEKLQTSLEQAQTNQSENSNAQDDM